MGRIGMPELLVIFLIILVLFGAKKLPEIGRSLGKAIREFKRAGKSEGEGVSAPEKNEDNSQGS